MTPRSREGEGKDLGSVGSEASPLKKILHLTLHRRWFDAIATGVKPEEYRATNAYWGKRLLKQNGGGPWVAREFDEVHFRNGYSKGVPWMRVEWKGLKPGTFEGKEVFAIQLGDILEIRNWSAPKGVAPCADPPQSYSPSPR